MTAARFGVAAPERIAALAVAATYAGTLALLPWLPNGALLGAAMAAAATSFLGWAPSGVRAPAVPIRIAGIPLHLLILGTGGLASPLVVAIVPWLAASTLSLTVRFKLAAGGAVALILAAADAWARRGGSGSAVAEALIVVAFALGTGWWVERLDRRARVKDAALERIRDEAASGRAAGAEAEAARRLDELAGLLDRVRRSLGAGYGVLWDVDPDIERARPRVASGGHEPSSVPLRGDPLGWAWDEGIPMRLESPPRWAGDHAGACVVPIESPDGRRMLLSLAFVEGVGLPSTDALEEVAGRLQVMLNMQRQAARAVTTRERYVLVTDLLRRMPRELSLDALAGALASAGVELLDGSGAAVALWEEKAGRVVAVVGEDGGPDVGATFEGIESEMALVARNPATLIRDERRGEARSLPVMAVGERWLAEPGSLVVVPLQDVGMGVVVGLLAVWNSEPHAIDHAAVEILETLAPYAALQIQQARTYGNMREQAERDPLTGLYNRRQFEAYLKEATARFHRYGEPVSLMLLDVDHFKSINDTYGHEAGDAVLEAVAASIQGKLREVDIAFRFGGEEFIGLLPRTDLVGARETAERLRLHIEATPVDWRGERIDVRVSVGVSAAPECVAEPRALVESADAALYAAKEGGRNRVTTAARRR